MILECIPSDLGTQHGDFYDGVPSLRLRETSIVPKTKPNIVIAYTRADVRRLLSDETRAIAWMGDEENISESMSDIPLIGARLLRLPAGVEYTGVQVENYEQSWGMTKIVVIDGTSYLAPALSQKGTGYRVSIDSEFQPDSVVSSADIRRKVLGHLGMPRKIRISPKGYIAINPTK